MRRKEIVFAEDSIKWTTFRGKVLVVDGDSSGEITRPPSVSTYSHDGVVTLRQYRQVLFVGIALRVHDLRTDGRCRHRSGDAIWRKGGDTRRKAGKRCEPGQRELNCRCWPSEGDGWWRWAAAISETDVVDQIMFVYGGWKVLFWPLDVVGADNVDDVQCPSDASSLFRQNVRQVGDGSLQVRLVGHSVALRDVEVE